MRAAHALAIDLTLTWSTGPTAALAVFPGSQSTSEWLIRLFVPAYDPGTWRPGAASPGQGGAAARRVGRIAGGILPVEDGPGPRWSDTVVRALPAFPSRLRAVWRFSPIPGRPPSGSARLGLEPEFQPPGYRLRAVPGPERELRDREVDARAGPFWSVELSLEDRSPAPRGDLDRFAYLVSIASSRGGRGRFEFRRPSRWRVGGAPRCFLSEPELLGILPNLDTTFSTPMAAADPVHRGLVMGTDSSGAPVEIPLRANEGRHLIALGETGMGKSSALIQLARGALGRGNIVLLDPIGDTGRAFLADLPSRFVADAVWISPHASPIAMDLLAALRSPGTLPPASDRAVSDLVSALRRVRAARYPETPFWGPRIEETVRAALKTAAAIPGASLSDLPRLLSASLRRPVGIPEEARASFEELAARARDRPEEVDGSRRLLAELTDRPTLVSLLGADGAQWGVREMFVPGRITVITGDAGYVGEDAARYLLAVYLALFWSGRMAERAPPKTFLVLDEAQWFAHDSVAEMLRLGRRENAHVWMATQSLDALPEAVRAAVRTNVADFLVFRGSPEDARDLGRMVPALTLEMIWSQPRGHALALIGKGEHIATVRLIPPAPLPPERMEGRLEAVRETSRRFLPGRAPDPVSEHSQPPAADPANPSGRAMLLALWSELLDLDPGATVRVHLDDLRRAFDPEGTGVRDLGRTLRDSGGLIRSDRDEHGSFWEVGRAGFDRLLGPGVDPRELDAAARRWRERPREGGASSLS